MLRRETGCCSPELVFCLGDETGGCSPELVFCLGEKPVVVVLKSGDLTQEEADRLIGNNKNEGT